MATLQPGYKKPGSSLALRFGVLLLALALTFVLAALLALAGPSKPAFLMIGCLAGTFLFLLDNERLTLVLAVLVFLVVGQLMYFARINQALWIPYGLGILLYLRLPGAFVANPLARFRIGLPLALPLCFFLLMIVVSSAVNAAPLLQVVVGAKGMVLLWSMYLMLVLFAVPFQKVERGFRLLFALVLLQLPFVMYQFFVVAPTRSNAGGRHGVSWDAVVGSFGGDPQGGGASGSMAYVLVLAMILALSLRRYRQISTFNCAAIWALALLVIGMAEVKVVVVLLPIGIGALFWREIYRRPVMALLGGAATLALSLSVLLVYNQLDTANSTTQAHDLGSLMDATFGYSLDPSLINKETGEMSRNAALVFWYHEGFRRDTLRGLVGFGPGASRSSSSFAVGEVARKYNFAIDRSSAAQLLWEVGLLGFLAYLGMIVWGGWLAMRSAPWFESDATKATLEACGAGLAMMVVMLPYVRDLLEVPALAFTLMYLLGYAAQGDLLRRVGLRTARDQAGAAAPQPV
jgi:hypothetical protein